MNKTTKELVEAARSVLPFLSRFSPERDRLCLAIAEVEAEESQTHSFAPSDWGATGEHCRVCSEPCNAPIHQKGVKS